MRSQDPLDRAPADLVPEVAQRAADPGVAPRGILPGQAADELLDVGRRPRSARLPSQTAVVLLRFCATSRWYHRNRVSGVTIGSMRCNVSRASRLALLARSRRSVSMKRRRRSPTCARRTRFSSWYSITSCCRRSSILLAGGAGTARIWLLPPVRPAPGGKPHLFHRTPPALSRTRDHHHGNGKSCKMTRPVFDEPLYSRHTTRSRMLLPAARRRSKYTPLPARPP